MHTQFVPHPSQAFDKKTRARARMFRAPIIKIYPRRPASQVICSGRSAGALNISHLELAYTYTYISIPRVRSAAGLSYDKRTVTIRMCWAECEGARTNIKRHRILWAHGPAMLHNVATKQLPARRLVSYRFSHVDDTSDVGDDNGASQPHTSVDACGEMQAPVRMRPVSILIYGREPCASVALLLLVCLEHRAHETIAPGPPA